MIAVRFIVKSKKVEETLESLTLLDIRKEMMKMVEKDLRYIEKYEHENLMKV